MYRWLGFASLLVAMIASPSASAATVKFTLVYSSNSNIWNLFVRELDGPADNGGIASYGVVLSNVLTVDHNSPRDGFGQGPTGVGAAGFTSLRSADNVPVLLASQDTITPTPNLIYGFGQAGNSFAAKGISDFTGGSQLESPTWDARLKIASGTYARGVALPQINFQSVDTFANVFISSSGTTTKAAQVVQFAEPTALALGSLSVVGLISAKRRCQRSNSSDGGFA